MMGFIAELQRRNVFRAATLYAAVAWLIVQVATQVLPVFGAQNWILRLIVIAAVLGFPFVLVISWYYELTPEGLKRESEVPRTESIAHVTGKRLDRAIIAVLSVIVVLLLANTFVSHRDATEVSDDKSVAVLPLLDEGGGADDQYFSDGLSEDLISMLSQVPGLKVIGRRSSFQFRGDTTDSRGIAAKLGVASLLEGSVRRQGKRVRIVASLVSAQDGRVLWSQVYERELKDIFDVQSDIAHSVAAALRIKLLGPASTPLQPSNRDPAAHNALLEGNFYFERHTENDYQKAIDYYSDAIRRDPRYALAYARRSVAEVYLAASFLGSDRATGVFSAARADAQTALAIDPNLAEGHLALGWIKEYADIDMRGAEAEYRRALELSPGDPVASRRMGGILANQGRLDEAVRYTQTAIAHDPLDSGNFFNLALYQTALGHFDQAKAALAKAIELQPDSAGFHMQLALIAILQGDHEAALDAARAEPAGPWQDYALAMSQQISGDSAQADAALQKLIDAHKTDMPFQIADVYALRKEPDAMFAWLDRAWSSHDAGITGLLYDPFLLAYKDDPRFVAFCGKAGLPAPQP